MTQAMNTEFNINDLVQQAQNRWLKPAEVLFILQNHENYQLTEVPPQKPTGGSLFLFNKRVTRSFRKDGHIWRKKKTGRTVREGHERLKVGSDEALNCYYAHGEQNSNFQRRSFWMLDPAYEHIVLVQYREITEGKHSNDSVHFFPDCSSVPSAGFYTAENRGSVSALGEPYQSPSFSPGSIELNSRFLIRSNAVNNMGGMGRIGEICSSPVSNVNQALGNIEEQLNLNSNTLPGLSPYFEENKMPNDSGVQNHEKSYNNDESVALQPISDGRERHQFSGVNAGFSNYSNSTIFPLSPGGYTMESKEVSSWNVLRVQCPGFGWIGQQDEAFNSVGQLIQENQLPFSERGAISTNLLEQQEIWTSQWPNSSGPRNNTENMNYCHLTVQNDFEPQIADPRLFLLGTDSIVSPTATSLLQEVESSNVLVHSSKISTHEANSNEGFNQINQLDISFEEGSSLIPAQKQRFRIHEISPEWGYSTEATKVIIVGSFIFDSLECTMSCMFGEIEVPMQFIQEGVLCCQAPPHNPGKVTLCITSGNRESCSEIREFEYRCKSSICDDCKYLQKDATQNSEELLLLVRFVQILLCDPVVPKEDNVDSLVIFGKPKLDEDPWDHILEALLFGTDTQLSPKDLLLQELLKDKLQQWLLSKYKQRDAFGCWLTKKEQGIIHLVAGLGFEWALNPILKCGVSIDYRDINGWTALHWAARFGREKMVASLIAARASAGAVTDPTPQDPVGKTPGLIAASSGHKGLAGYLSEVALTSHLSSLTLEENEISNGSSRIEVDKTVESISKESVSSIDEQLSLKDSLAAVRNSTQAAGRIQSFFRILSYKRTQQREAAAAAWCNVYGITPDELAAASKLTFRHFHDHKLDEAALSIQKQYRGWKGRQEFLALRQKIVMIQAHVRGYQVRKRYTVILWAVGCLDKVVLRWSRKRVGLRGFQQDLASFDEREYEDIIKAFRKLKVDQSVDEALSRVLLMAKSPEARQQYHRILESYLQSKTDLFGNASQAAPDSQIIGDN